MGKGFTVSTAFPRLHLSDVSGSKEERVPGIAAFNLRVIKLGKSTTKNICLQCQERNEELVLLVSRTN